MRDYAMMQLPMHNVTQRDTHDKDLKENAEALTTVRRNGTNTYYAC